MLADTKENRAKIAALKKVNECEWNGTTVHDTLDKCLVAINLYSHYNSGLYSPRGSEVPGLSGIFMINQDGSLFCEARVIKEKDKYFRIEYMSMRGWNEFEELYFKFLDELNIE